MDVRVGQTAIVGAAVGYLAVLSWSITNLTYDVWGILVIVPPLGVAGAAALRHLFRHESSELRAVMYAGLGAKLIGAAARYWVGFDAYGGGIDAQRYHDYAAPLASAVWRGEASLWSVLPTDTGTPFTEGVTALLYTLTGPSKMAGFVVFSFLGYLGVAFFVKAACITVPDLARVRYAVLCALAPSLVYWPSSIGKEALMMFVLGVTTYGMALVLSRRAVARGILLTVVGLVGAAYVRPHLAGIWLAGLLPALMVMVVSAVVRSPQPGAERRGTDLTLLVGAVVVAAVGLVAISMAAVRYLSPGDDDEATATTTSSISAIFDETSRRTVQARSSFEPPHLSSPVVWPYASLRTLTRPLLIEARGAAQIFTALEITVLLGACLVAGRRIANLPRLMLTNPFVTFSMSTLLLAGLAYSSFANLGVLARQKSLVFPFMLLVVCVPPIPPRRRAASNSSSYRPSAAEPVNREAAGREPAGREAAEVPMR